MTSGAHKTNTLHSLTCDTTDVRVHTCYVVLYAFMHMYISKSFLYGYGEDTVHTVKSTYDSNWTSSA